MLGYPPKMSRKGQVSSNNLHSVLVQPCLTITNSQRPVHAILTLSCRSGLIPDVRRSSTSLWWPW